MPLVFSCNRRCAQLCDVWCKKVAVSELAAQRLCQCSVHAWHQYWFSTGSVLVQYWFSTGSVLVQYWFSTGPVLVQYWYSTCPLLAQYWLSTGSVLGQYWSST